MPLRCEIHATPPLASNLQQTVAFCAGQTGYMLDIVTREPANAHEATVTLHLPPESATSDLPLSCFICRLACLCPQARVGIFVPAHDLFARERICHAS